MVHKILCPKITCENHTYDKKPIKWLIKIGFYQTKTFGPVQRYQCKSCKTTFSDQTFSIDYFTKKKVNYRRIFEDTISKSGVRHMSRVLSVSTATILNRIARLARQAIGLHEGLKNHISLNENLVADGFESFAVSQYFPDNINILVGEDSQYVYSADYVTIRRKGRMTAEQKETREELEQTFKADPRGIEKSFTSLLDELYRIFKRSSMDNLTLHTDKKRDYKRAINKHCQLKALEKEGVFEHQTTSSRKARTRWNPLFPVNYIDRLLRASLAMYVRETIEFCRNINDGMNRLMLFIANHNYWKRFRINHKTKDNVYHGEKTGLKRDLIESSKRTFFTKRVLCSMQAISENAKKVW